MTRPVTAHDRERGEEDSVLGILKRIEESANRGSWYTRSGAGVLIEIRDLASDAIAQIEAMSTLDGQRSYALGIEEKHKELEQRERQG